jgi:nicotinamidase-related amidase
MKTIHVAAEPVAVDLALAETALMIIDMQKDFLYPQGYGAFLGNDTSLLLSAVQPIQSVLSAARAAEMLIIHTREGHLPDLSDCPPTKLTRWPAGGRIGDLGPMGRILIHGEVGHAIVDELTPLPDEIVLDKPGKSSFYATQLDSILRANGIKNLLITGVTTDVCCFSTVIAANDHGYNAIVLSDCVASYSPQRHTSALETIKAQGGIFGWVSTSLSLLAAFGE